MLQPTIYPPQDVDDRREDVRWTCTTTADRNGIGTNSRKMSCRAVAVARTVAAAAVLAVVGVPSIASADADADFARSKKCMSCHAIDEKRIGPPYKAVAAKYANDKGAEARLAKKIKEGGSGVWGVLVMPPNDVTTGEAQRLAHWVLMQR